jgi:hypothetical protein
MPLLERVVPAVASSNSFQRRKTPSITIAGSLLDPDVSACQPVRTKRSGHKTFGEWQECDDLLTAIQQQRSCSHPQGICSQAAQHMSRPFRSIPIFSCRLVVQPETGMFVKLEVSPTSISCIAHVTERKPRQLKAPGVGDRGLRRNFCLFSPVAIR